MHDTERVAAGCKTYRAWLLGQVDLCQEFATREIPDTHGAIVVRHGDSLTCRIGGYQRWHAGK